MNLFSLGDLYISDFLADGEQPRSEPWPLRLVMDDDTRVVHLAEQPPPELMWGRYWYHSGTTLTMARALRDLVGSVEPWVDLATGDVWVDIASNDGTLLSFVPERYVRVGVDPAEDSFRLQCEQHANLVIQEPFSLDAWRASKYGERRAKVVTCAAMIYDLMDPTQFLADVRQLLEPAGLFVLQLSYTPLMLDGLAFDNICHEHACYYTLNTLYRILHMAGFRVLDATLNDVNGGSLRVHAVRSDVADVLEFGTGQVRYVARFRVDALLAYEREFGYDDPYEWHLFAERVGELRDQVVGFVRDVRARGKTVDGLGASTKGNTLLQYFGLDHTLIRAIAERQPGKVGLRTIGTDIPIVSEEEMRAAPPNYLLVLPWAFIGEIQQREADYLAAGGRLIVPCPRFAVIGADGIGL